MANYYASFIPRYAHTATPLSALLKKSSPWSWGAAQSRAFSELKEALCSKPLLVLPDLHKDKEFIIETDASDHAVGAVL